MEKSFLMTAMGYLLLGMALGIFMAMTQSHLQQATHGHILLVGFVLSFVYAVCHRLWLTSSNAKGLRLQHALHQIGALVLIVGLFLMYQGLAPGKVVGPIMGLGAISLLVAAVLMKIALIKAFKS